MIPVEAAGQSFEARPAPQSSSARLLRLRASRTEFESQGDVFMAGQVILYFDDQADALRFALAAGSVMAGDGSLTTDDLAQETSRITRIRLDAAKGDKSAKATNPDRAA